MNAVATSKSRSKRTDPHRPGAIVPADYSYVLSYALPTSEGGWPVPGHNFNCELDHARDKVDANGKYAGRELGQHHADGRCCILRLRQTERFAATGGAGKCSICGAHFVYGELWKHEPTGEHVHLGHDCAEKYELMQDLSTRELVRERFEKARAVEIERGRKHQARQEFLAQHAGPELEAALAGKHPILQDLAQRFRRDCRLSDKQVALALKIHHEELHPPTPEKLVAAPTGKLTVRGRVVSCKVQEFGGLKMTVKVETPEGNWLAWGTAPRGAVDEGALHGQTLRGCLIELTATFKPGREAHFAKIQRPRAKLIELAAACEQPCRGCVGDDHRFFQLQLVAALRSEERQARDTGNFDRATHFSQWASDLEAASGSALPFALEIARHARYWLVKGQPIWRY